jgi:hypothetical protein
MEHIDTGDESISDAEDFEIVIVQEAARVPGEDEKRKSNCDGDELDEAVEQYILTDL